jgi:alpha-galactosidase
MKTARRLLAALHPKSKFLAILMDMKRLSKTMIRQGVIVLCFLVGAGRLRADVASLQASLNAAQGSVFLSDGTAAPEEIVLSHTVKAGEIHSTLTNRGTKFVRISEVVLFDAPHTLPAETRLYGEGFTKLSQTAGTFAKPQNIGDFSDHKHYRIPAPQGLFTVYNMLSLAPERDKRLLLAFTSSQRFAGRFSFNSERLRVSQDLENLELPPGKSFTLESMSVESGTDREVLLDQLARRLNNNHSPLKHNPIPCGWSSWVCFGPGVTSKDVASNSAWIKHNLPALKYVQIDDGYQPWMGDWLDTGKAFGGGVQNVLKQIRADGLEPALWVAPFVASPESKLFKQHPDWFMKDADGKPLRSDKVTFGGWRLGPWYALDATHPDAQKWLEETFRTMTRDWGVTYFKLDANYWGAMHGAKLHDPAATRIEAYRRGMQAILRGTGNSFILGCNHPLWPSLGLIHGSRSSMDITRSFKSFTDTGRENLYRSWQNGKIWAIDPDSLLLGDATSKDVMGPDGKPVTTGNVTFDNLLFHATLLRATGGMLLSGDDLPKLTPNLVSILRKAVPPTKGAFRFADESFTTGRFTDGNTEWIALLNWDDVPVKRVIEFKGNKHITEYWTDKDLGSHEGSIEIPAMPPCSGMLLKLD